MCRSCRIIVLSLLLVATISYWGIAQENGVDLKKEIEELKQGQQTIRKDLLEIRSLLSRNAAQGTAPAVNVKDVNIDLGNHPVTGSPTAKLMLIEVSDYQCPYCNRYLRETFPKISEQYVDKGTIRYAVMDQPLSMHKMAAKAAEASHCANDQGKFWEIHKLMMSKQESLENLISYASALNLDLTKFEECLKANKYKDQVDKDSAFAQRLGIMGVPGFIVASADSNDQTKARGISFISGAQPLAVFQRELDQALASLVAQNPLH